MIRIMKGALYGLGVSVAVFLVFLETRADCRELTREEQFALFGGVPIVIDELPPGEWGKWQPNKRCSQQTIKGGDCYKDDILCAVGQAYCAESPQNHNTVCVSAKKYNNPTRCGVYDLQIQCQHLPPPEQQPDNNRIECYSWTHCLCKWTAQGGGWINPECYAPSWTPLMYRRCQNR